MAKVSSYRAGQFYEISIFVGRNEGFTPNGQYPRELPGYKWNRGIIALSEAIINTVKNPATGETIAAMTTTNGHGYWKTTRERSLILTVTIAGEFMDHVIPQLAEHIQAAKIALRQECIAVTIKPVEFYLL